MVVQKENRLAEHLACQWVEWMATKLVEKKVGKKAVGKGVNWVV